MSEPQPEPRDRARGRTQRLGAYAVVFWTTADTDLMLLTRISTTGYPAGYWTLPGGGVDHGESPHDAVRRELYEETGLSASAIRLVDVHDVHEVEQGRDDRYEDYHGVHLLYAAQVDLDTSLQVIDVGGSTDVAEWVPVEDIGAGHSPVLPMVTHAVAHRAEYVWPS